MNHFQPIDGRLHAEGVDLTEVAQAVGTPTYVYSRATFERHLRVVRDAIPLDDRLIAYSVKACSNLAILALLGKLGAGADVVSGGELCRAIAAGIPATRIVFSGVGKTRPELAAAIEAGIYAINAESTSEIELISSVAEALGIEANVSLRINPNVDAKTHPYIATGLRENKFGIPLERALETYDHAVSLPGVRVRGVACHIGSQLTDLAPIEEALQQMLGLLDSLRAHGIEVECLDMGGGLGIPYGDEEPPSPREYGELMARYLKGRNLRLVIEPGRVIAGNAGIILTRVVHVKDNGAKRFVIVDAGMNDLLRPALYKSYHAIEAVDVRSGPPETVDVVGPICESADVFAKDRLLTPLASGDLLVLRSAGAYSFSMASNYNSRPRPAEVLVDGDRYAVVRQRETLADLTRLESVPTWVES